jgi:succinoglycan biosynthesis protein ExoA
MRLRQSYKSVRRAHDAVLRRRSFVDDPSTMDVKSARLIARSTSENSDLVTVVVPARNEEAFIGSCLDSILAQRDVNLQIVVVDGASIDGTAKIVQSHAERDSRIEYLFNPDANIPMSLNLALSVAKGRWLVRIDAHSKVPPDYVSRAVQHLRTGKWGGVGGRKDGVGVTAAGRAIAAAMASRWAGSVYHYGTETRVVQHVPFGAYPTALVRELGGWDERIPANEDFEFDYRVRKEKGQDLLFDPLLVISWHCRESIAELFHQYLRYGRGKARVLAMHHEAIEPRNVMAPLLVGLLVGAVAVFPVYPLPALAATIPYGIFLVSVSTSRARKVRDMGAKIRIAAAYLAMHLGWGIGFWRGVVDVLRDGEKADRTLAESLGKN